MAANKYEVLTQEDVDHFMKHGWVKISNAFSQEQADDLIGTVWTRLGMDPEDKSTWHTERINMPHHKEFSAKEFSPKTWQAVCDLVGGDERISDENRTWRDGLIVNLGTEEGEGKQVHGSDLPGWHVDGDFFVHYLDSPEQGLLLIPLFTEIQAGGGGTMICPDAIPVIAKHLYEHPEGVSPRMTPRGSNPAMDNEASLKFYCDLAKTLPKDSFYEATGKVGDVYLLHPLMLHSASNNSRRTLRVITNPPVSLNSPFVFDREDASEYSVVERKTLASLGKEKLDGWKITGSRDRIIPERLKKQDAMKQQELLRLAGQKVAADVSITEIKLNA